jgi:hypothetical protein
MVKKLCLGTILYFFLLQTSTATLTASVDRKTVRIDETLTLTINSDKPLTLAPNLNLLTSALQPLSRNNFSRISYVNGKRVVESGWQIQLIALEEGIATIPTFTIEGETTKAIQIRILPPNQSNTDGGLSPLFTELKISDINPYVQQQIILTVKVSSDSDIDNAQLQPPQLENALVRSLGEPTEYVSRLSGELYRIREYQFSIFPQKEGLLKIPAMIFQGNKIVRHQSRNPLSLLSSQSRRVRIRTEELVVDVKAAVPSAHTWLPAKKLTLSSDWRPELTTLTIGEPITRVLTIEAVGLDATQLPEIQMPDIEGMSWFPNPAERDNNFDGVQISSQSKQRFALMPNKAGEYTLPAIEIQWYNIETNKFTTARIESQQIDVIPAVAKDPLNNPLDGLVLGAPKKPSAIEPQPINAKQSDFWKIIALSMIAVWILSIAGFIFSRRFSKINHNNRNPSSYNPTVSVQPFETVNLKPASTWKGVAKQIKGQSSLVAYNLIKAKSEDKFENFDEFLKQLDVLGKKSLVAALEKLLQAAFSENSSKQFDTTICKLLAQLDSNDASLNPKKRSVKISPLYDK